MGSPSIDPTEASPAMPHDDPGEMTSTAVPEPAAEVISQDAEKEPPTGDPYRFMGPGQVEYPFFSDPETGRALVVKHGDERQFPDGPPEDGHWVPVEPKE